MAQTNTFDTIALGTDGLLRSAAIYGPNASGKSNLIRGLRTMRQIVLTSASDLQRGDPLPVTPFLLDDESEQAPSDFEAVFVAGNVRYQYGFSATSEQIMEEWLYAYPHGRPQRWIGRLWNSESKRYDWDAMTALTGRKQLWQESTRNNALFLSTAVKLNSKKLQPVFDWFKKMLKPPLGEDGWNPGYTASKCTASDERERVLKFLNAADLGISDVMIESEKFSAKYIPDELPDSVKEKILSDFKDTEVFDVKTIHRTPGGKEVVFNLDEESQGTRRLFAFAARWLEALDNGQVIVVDELHDSLHPQLTEFLLKLFHSVSSNPNNAQLIFTAHETSILNQEVFRRDQIWLCEKEKSQATRLTPLTDFSPRKGRENLEAAYLAGRYGALPFIRTLDLPVNKKNGNG